MNHILEEKQMKSPRVVSEAEWLVARKELLAREKEFTRQRDALSEARRTLPMVRVEKGTHLTVRTAA